MEVRRGRPEQDIALLPTPVVNDMGSNKTVDWWDSWVVEKKAQHGNGNGHGKSLTIEVKKLLLTPKSTNNENRQSLDRYGPNLGMAVRGLSLNGESTNQPSGAGSPSSADPPPTPPTPKDG